uniref:Glutaredoxin domain-containing protein n=1 Tax=Chaetoceros debilis TaxID=122233 RepID=A0A7S3Q5U2_9STRA|mmetsp:Transcript_3204/g.4729  ORF Transcript_3204/g.4729 Transcript_3204/m.4729 type:complete len:391 (+) Transcript_3204:79-1251(+)
MTVTELSSAPPSNTKCVLFYWASWHEATAPQGSTSKIYETLASALASTAPDLSFYRVEAEAHPSLSSMFNVSVVPSFVLIREDGQVLQTIEGSDDVAKLTSAVSQLRSSSSSLTGTTGGSGADVDVDVEMGTNENTMTSASSSSSSPAAETETDDTPDEEKINARLKKLIHSSQVMLFMKGSPSQPKCGFSRQAIELLTSSNIAFHTFDILSDNDVRQGLKTYSDWPTFPQLYVNGDLLGGLDIMKEMAEEGEESGSLGLGLAEQMGVATITEQEAEAEAALSVTLNKEAVVPLEDRLRQLLQRSKVMLFMKGLPSQPKCGFSRQICEILQDQNIDFDSFDILGDDEVRQGLKKFSDWPTYPQLYVDGDLIGGLDIVKEMVEEDELKDLV